MSEQRSEQSIFLHAIALTAPADRAAYLDEACRDQPSLRAELDALIAAHDRLGGAAPPRAANRSYVETAASEGSDDVRALDIAGEVIGPYKLLESIGEGGFGVVYLAEQTQPIRRKVALKVLKAGMDTKQVVARFEAERQALALMDHPNIAQVYDGGQTPPAYAGGSPRPYFVMELVRGAPITDFCDQNHLNIRQRLELFVNVCQAVQHAHQKGIIHRDLKPSNIMIASNDGTPVVKVIDFGIAKAMSGQLTDKTYFTGFAQMIGTPLYMSPEQAGQSNIDVDTRSDIYSLGVLLYELLTGTTPFDKEQLSKLSYDELRRIIREEEPPRPSTRISTLGNAASTASANRQCDPRALSRQIRGELDWIVMRALEKDRNRRYETASAFAADVQRYLSDEPVLACPPSVGYRLRKFVRRNKGPVVAVALVVLALVVGIAGTSWQAFRATWAEEDALWERDEKDTALEQAKRDRDAKILALIGEQKERERADDHRKLAYSALDKIFFRLVEDELPRHPDRLESNRRVLQETLAFYDSLAKRDAKDPASQKELAIAYVRAGRISALLNEDHKALEYLDNARGVFGSLHEREPTNWVTQEDYAGVLSVMAKQHMRLGDLTKAETLLDDSIRLWTNIPVKERSNSKNRGATMIIRGQLLRKTGRLAEAESTYSEATNLLEGVPEPTLNHEAALAQSVMEWGITLFDGDRFEEAERIYRRSLTLHKRLVEKSRKSAAFQDAYAIALLNYSACLSRMHRDADASKMITEAIRVTQQLVRDYPLAPKYRALLVELFVNHSATTSDVELARDPTLFEAALRLADENITRARHVPEYRLDYVKIHNNYAAHKYELGDWTGVEQILGKNEAQARSLVEEHGQVPEYHRQVIWLLHTRAKAREKINKLELAENDTRDALAHARRLVEILPKSAAASVELAGAHHQLGRALRNRSQHKDALVQLDEALRMLRPLYDKKSLSYAGRYQLGSTYLTHGSTRYDLKDFSGALESFQHGDDVLQAELKVSPKAGPPHDALALVYRNRGVVFTAMKQVDKADQAYRRSIVLQDRLFKEVAPEPNYGHTLMLHTERFFFFTLDYRPKRLGELEPILRRAVEVGEEIVKRDPKRKDYREYLGLMCNALGNILVIGNRFGEAEKFVLRMAEVGEELTRQDGTNRKYQEMRQQGWNNVVLVASATENDALLIKAAERLVALNPANVDELNGLAWYLATCRDVKLRDPARAIKLSEQSIAGLERESKDKAKLGDHYGTLGAAYCRNGQHALAVAKLARALELRPNDAATVTFNHYYLALSHWKLDDKKKAQEAYDVALKSIEKLTPNDEQHRAHLTRLRAEIAELLGIRLEPKKN